MYQKYICVGNLTRDAELKYTNSGKSLAVFDIAVNTKYKDKQDTIFWKCTLWNAEKLVQYLTKGKRVLIEGIVKEEKWEDRNGTVRVNKVLQVEVIKFLGGRDG